MSRVGLVVAAAAAVMGIALAGCSGSMPSLPDWMSPPDWMRPKPSAPPMQALRFESEPPDADVRTAQGQTCQTPCALAVSTENQSVTFTKNGFLPQTVQVSVGQPPEHSFFESPPPALVPNPVVVTLQAVPRPTRAKPKPHVGKSPTAARSAAPEAASGTTSQAAAPDGFVAASPTQQPASSVFPPPPPTR